MRKSTWLVITRPPPSSFLLPSFSLSLPTSTIDFRPPVHVFRSRVKASQDNAGESIRSRSPSRWSGNRKPHGLLMRADGNENAMLNWQWLLNLDSAQLIGNKFQFDRRENASGTTVRSRTVTSWHLDGRRQNWFCGVTLLNTPWVIAADLIVARYITCRLFTINNIHVLFVCWYCNGDCWQSFNCFHRSLHFRFICVTFSLRRQRFLILIRW